MIKLILSPILLLIFCLGLSGQSTSNNTSCEFSVDGYLKESKDGVAVLGYFDLETSKPVYLDTSNLINGKFHFTGKIGNTVKVVISFNNVESNQFFVDPGYNMVKGYHKIVNGEVIIEIDSFTSKSNLDARRKRKYEEKIFLERGKALFDRYNVLDSILTDSLNLDSTYFSRLKDDFMNCEFNISKYYNYLDSMQFAYIKENPDSFESAFDFCFQIRSYTVEKAIKKYKLFSDNVKNSIYGKYIYQQIKKKESVLQSINHDFTKIDINDDTIRLSDYRGKYVLLEFWASWCKPCRASHPKLLSLYKQYHHKGFEIISISSSEPKGMSSLKQAISKDSIGIWTHILDNSKGANNLSLQFNIEVLPTKVLINKEGNIFGIYQSDNFSQLQTDLNSIFE